MNERIRNMKDNIQRLNDEGVRKTKLYQYIFDSLVTTEGEPAQIRRAKAFAHLLDVVELKVFPYELIAGSMLGLCPLYPDVPSREVQRAQAKAVLDAYLEKKRADAAFDGTIQFSEAHVKSFEEDFASRKSRWTLMSRVHHDASIPYRDLQDLIEEMKESYRGADLEPYEIGRELERAFKIDYPAEVKKAYSDLPWFIGNHLSLNYGKMAGKGLARTREQIEQCLKETSDPEKREYYQSALITIEAVIRFIRRYAQTLREEASGESEERSAELLRLAGICERISEKPAEGFYEALQLVWMLHTVASIQGGSALSFGRLDQYLYPYYAEDRKNGRISDEEVKELLSCVWLKINEPKMRTVQSVTLGGLTRDGKNACNELTRLCLEVTGDVAMPYPNVGLRVNPLSPEWLYEAALDSIAAGCGQPMLMNDEVWIPNTMRLGYAQEDANDYYNMGCVEIMIPGKQPNWGVTDAIAFPVLIEQVMRRLKSGQATAESFADFMKLYFEEMDRAVDRDRQEALGKREGMKKRCFDPYSSLLIDGCLENGRDMFQEGSECPTHWSVYAYGIGTAADSLCAVKKYVYEEKRFTLAQLNELLEQNFEGHEDIRRMLERESPAYGNGLEEVDSIGNQVLSHFTKSVMELNGSAGRDRFVSTLFGYFFHIYHGEVAQATPDGRRKGEPFSDSMGPNQGRDVQGPTRLLNSVLHLNNDLVTGGYALNFKINPEFCREEKGRESLIRLLQAYFANGGPQIQLYTTNVEDLKDAEIHPEKHRDLIVRVGGYCEYFVNLDRALQKEIIKRTIYGAA
ncbi:MAG: pyruvate formate lyase [Lachnospiraceae bacterium]|nr:pyruvate formate lyase [Lachnospiraceae bacterium]